MRLPGTPPRGAYEENIPLTESGEFEEPDEDRGRRGEGPGRRKGKERAAERTPKEEIFRVDDSDDEDTRTPRTAGR